jgi:hypothetical protein
MRQPTHVKTLIGELDDLIHKSPAARHLQEDDPIPDYQPGSTPLQTDILFRLQPGITGMPEALLRINITLELEDEQVGETEKGDIYRQMYKTPNAPVDLRLDGLQGDPSSIQPGVDFYQDVHRLAREIEHLLSMVHGYDQYIIPHDGSERIYHDD